MANAQYIMNTNTTIDNLNVSISSLQEQLALVESRLDDNDKRVSGLKTEQSEVSNSVTRCSVENLTDDFLNTIQEKETRISRDLLRCDKIHQSLTSAYKNLQSQLESEQRDLKNEERQQWVDKISKLAIKNNELRDQYAESCEEINSVLGNSRKVFNYPDNRLYEYAVFSNRHRSLQKIKCDGNRFYLEVVS